MNIDLFKKGISALGGTVSEEQLSRFKTYSDLLKEWNKKINLTAITDDDGITVKHFLDSILPLFSIDFPQQISIADIGTGAGFPGLPLKIMRPDIEVTLIDSLQKRINFLNEVCAALELDKVSCIHGRAEELGKDTKHREAYDIIVSRAVANLKVLCEYCLPFVKINGVFIALKSENSDSELDSARAMIGTLGGKVEEVKELALPESDIIRKLIIIRKISHTPPQFPRRANKIK